MNMNMNGGHDGTTTTGTTSTEIEALITDIKDLGVALSALHV